MTAATSLSEVVSAVAFEEVFEEVFLRLVTRTRPVLLTVPPGLLEPKSSRSPVVVVVGVVLTALAIEHINNCHDTMVLNL